MIFKKYSDFLFEKKSAVICPMVYRPDFKDILSQIGTPISGALLQLDGTEQEITYIEPTADGLISYVSSADAYAYMVGIGYENPSPIEIRRFLKVKMIDSSVRKTKVRVGKFVKSLLKDRFSDPEYASFVDRWRSIFANNSYRFEIWEGERIVDAYDTENYLKAGMTELSKSCMNNSEYVEFYSYIKGCRILVLLKNDLITARALLWNSKDGIRLMDRVYFNSGVDYQMMIRWAEENGIWHKKSNISGVSQFTLGGSSKDMHIEVDCPDVFRWDGYGFPYMDTLCYASGRTLSNFVPDGKYYKLQDTDGGFDVYSSLYDIYGDIIEDEDDYVYSDTLGGYIRREEAFLVRYNGGSGFESYSFYDWLEKGQKYPDFVEYEGKLYRISDCVFSEVEDRWIWRPDAIYDKTDWVSYQNFKTNR